MAIGRRLSDVLKSRGIRVSQLAEYTGISAQTLYSVIRRDNAKISFEQLEKISEALCLDISFFTGQKDNFYEPESYPVGTESMIPVVGAVRAGWNALAESDYEGSLAAYDVKNPERFVWLRVKGDSMEPRMFDGDHVLVRLQNTAENGDYVVAILDGEEGTIKKFQRKKDGIFLIPLNEKYTCQFIPKEQQDRLYIYGVAVEVKGIL